MFVGDAKVQIDHTPIASGTPIQLAQGNHRIEISPASAALTWQYADVSSPEAIPNYDLFHDPVTPNGLTASFYSNGNWDGTPVAKRIVPFVYQLIQIIPMNRPYSVRYDGYIYAPETGEYHFGLIAIDTGALDIDGKNVLKTVTPNEQSEVVFTLTPGWHAVEVRHQDLTSATRIFLTWIPPGQQSEIPIARDYFCPALNLCAVPAH